MSSAFPILPDPDEVQRALDLLELHEEPVIYDADERHRIDSNFVLIEQLLKTRPPSPVRGGSDARVDPDDIRLFWVTLGLTAFFATAAFVASFAGQYAMAANTYLPSYLRALVPLFIDLPIIVVSLSILIFRRRRQSVLISWILLATLTAMSSAINGVHVLASAGVLTGAPLTLPVTLGAAVMAGAPILVLVSWEELSRLAIKPIDKDE